MQDQNVFNRWFRSEVGAAFAVGVAVAGVLMFILNQTNPLQTQTALLQQELSEIKNNDLTHIELEIGAEQQVMTDFNKIQIAQGQQITEILTILRQNNKSLNLGI